MKQEEFFKIRDDLMLKRVTIHFPGGINLNCDIIGESVERNALLCGVGTDCKFAYKDVTALYDDDGIYVYPCDDYAGIMYYYPERYDGQEITVHGDMPGPSFVPPPNAGYGETLSYISHIIVGGNVNTGDVIDIIKRSWHRGDGSSLTTLRFSEFIVLSLTPGRSLWNRKILYGIFEGVVNGRLPIETVAFPGEDGDNAFRFTWQL